MKMIQLYKKHLPTTVINTRFGKIPQWDFLQREKDRLESLGRKVEIEGGYIGEKGRVTECCLIVNKIA